MAAAKDRKTAAAMLLVSAMQSGDVIDTKFFAFARRRSAGGADHPLPIYANSSLLMASAPQFISSGGFAEDRIGPLSEPFPADKEELKQSYAYDSDSDLDDGEDETAVTTVAQANHGDEGEETKDSEAHEESTGIPPSDELSQVPNGRCGRIIVLSSGAHRTWNALLAYLYTGDLEFAQLKSSRSQTQEVQHQSPFTFRCSPKSMYRLADEYGMTELKKQALDGIKKQLTADNIMQELQSSLTTTHKDIQEIEIAFACEASQRPAVLKGLHGWITQLATNELAHTAECLHSLVQRIAAMHAPTSLMYCSRCEESWPDRQFRCTECKALGAMQV
ncbi:hypothetical protein BC629DRAFT_1587226 [Irpex lacteus]|nr:hypothetical protein BC629DRAFT_1587226 [Irpex lacteus]